MQQQFKQKKTAQEGSKTCIFADPLEESMQNNRRPETSPGFSGKTVSNMGSLYSEPSGISRPQTTPSVLNRSTLHPSRDLGMPLFSQTSTFRTVRESALFADSVYHALFELPPALPHVDAHIQNSDLKLRNVKSANWELRLPPHSSEILKTARLAVTKSRRVRRSSSVHPTSSNTDTKAFPGSRYLGDMTARLIVNSKGRETSSDMPIGGDVPSLTLLKAKSNFLKLSSRSFADTPKSNQPRKNSIAVSCFTDQELSLFVKYVDSFGNGDGEMDLQELKDSFKRITRNRAQEAYLKYGEKQLVKLQNLPAVAEMDLASWFNKIASGKSPNKQHSEDSKISVALLRDNLPRCSKNRYFTPLGSGKVMATPRTSRSSSGTFNAVPLTSRPTPVNNVAEDLTFSDAEIVALLRFIYPDSTAPPNELRLKDLLRAAGKVGKAPMGAESIEKKAALILDQLELYMTEKSLRVNDLFYMLDTKGSGKISAADLKLGIAFVFRDDPRTSALENHRSSKAQKAEDAKVKLKSKVRLARARVDKAKFTGAYDTLKKIEKLKRATGMRLADIFGRCGFDVSGDGSLDAMEIHGMLQSMRVNCTIDQVNAMVNYLDKNGNGKIEPNEVEEHLHKLKQDELLVAQNRSILNDTSISSPGDELAKKIAAVQAFNKFKKSQQQQEAISTEKTISMRDRLSRLNTKELTATPKKKNRKKKDRQEQENKAGTSEALSSNDGVQRKKDPFFTKTCPRKLKPLAGSALDDRWLHSFDSRLDRDKKKMLCN